MPWLIHTSRATWLMQMCDMTHEFRVKAIPSPAPLPLSMCVYDMTHSYVWHDSWIQSNDGMHDMTHEYRVKTIPSPAPSSLSMYVYAMTHSYITCDMTHADVWHDSWIQSKDDTLSRTFASLYVCVCHDSSIRHVWHDSFICRKWHDSFICVTRTRLMKR